MENKLISVIIPVYNASRYLDVCIGGVLKQTYRNFELILVNDGSKDNSLELCRLWESKDSRIKVIDRENGGASAARNTGLNYVHGEYVIFVDSDDFVSPHYLENLYRAAEIGGFDIVQCNLASTYEQLQAIPAPLFSADHVKEITKQDALNRRLYKVSVCGKIYSTYILKNFRFKEGVIYEDDASYYVFVYRSEKIALLNETLYYYYQSPNSVMRNDRKMSMAFIDIYEERKAYFQDRKEETLYKGSVSRFCIVLMLAYVNIAKEEKNTKKILLEQYRNNYKLIKWDRDIPFKDSLVCLIFRMAPSISAFFIRKIRKKKRV